MLVISSNVRAISMSDELLTRLQDVIYNPKISREKRQEIQNVWTAIDSLDQHLREFENAIKLFEYSHQEYLRVEGELLRVQTTLSEKLIRNDWSELSSLHQELFSKSMQYFSWKQMAAREGAMIVFHYFKRRQRISHIVNTCSQLDRTRTRSYLKKANGILNEAFPSLTVS